MAYPNGVPTAAWKELFVAAQSLGADSSGSSKPMSAEVNLSHPFFILVIREHLDPIYETMFEMEQNAYPFTFLESSYLLGPKVFGGGYVWFG